MKYKSLLVTNKTLRSNETRKKLIWKRIINNGVYIPEDKVAQE